MPITINEGAKKLSCLPFAIPSERCYKAYLIITGLNLCKTLHFFPMKCYLLYMGVKEKVWWWFIFYYISAILRTFFAE